MSTYHKVFGEHDGFEIDIVRAMNFDEDDFLWLGGESLDNREIIFSDKNQIIQRFNGNTFHNIQLPKYDEKITRINQIYKRKDGQFYLKLEIKITEQKLLLFNPISMEFQKISTPELVGNRISSVFKYQNKDYIIIENKEDIILYQLQKNLTVSLICKLNIPKNYIDIYTRFIGFKDYFILSDNQLNITYFDWKGTKIKELPLPKNNALSTWIDEVFTKENITYFFLYNDPQLYFVDENSLEIKPVDSSKITSPNFKHLIVYQDKYKNNLIISKQNNLLSIQTFTNGKLKKVIKDVDFGNTEGLHSISNDIDDGFWISTELKELHYFKLPTSKVKIFLENKGIRTIKQLNQNEFLVATEQNGWFVVNLKTGEEKPYQLLKDNKVFKPISSRNIFLEQNAIWSHSEGHIFKTTKNTSEIESWDNFGITCIEKLNDSLFIYGTDYNGLHTFHKRTKKHQAILKSDSLFIYDISFHKNIIASATNKGLLIFDTKSKKSILYTAKDGLPSEFLLMTDYHPKYGFLVGSRDGKIIAFNETTSKFTSLYEDELSAGIATISIDKNTWWIHTFKGFVLFDSNLKTTKRFGIQNGFSSNEANRYSTLKTKEGVFIGTIKGLNFLNPEDLVIKKNNSKLVLLNIKKFDKKKNAYIEIQNRHQINQEKNIIIPSENRNLELDFSVTNSAASKQYNFRYRLNNEAWVHIKNQQTIRFANLEAGNYSLEIEALDFSNKKIGEALLLNIESKKFFYKTWWFYLIICMLIISFFSWILNQTAEKKKVQEKFSQDLLQSQEEERTRIARELHDSVGQQLTLIKRKSQNLQQEEIAILTNNALDEVRSISRNLYPALLKELGLIESIEQLINEYDEQTDLFFSMDIDAVNSYFTEATSLHFYRMIQECLTNIVKHAKAKSVSVSVKKEPTKIVTTISDNGVGFDINHSKMKNSLGLKTIFERIKIMNGTISIDSKVNKGTHFLISIPVKK